MNSSAIHVSITLFDRTLVCFGLNLGEHTSGWLCSSFPEVSLSDTLNTVCFAPSDVLSSREEKHHFSIQKHCLCDLCDTHTIGWVCVPVSGWSGCSSKQYFLNYDRRKYFNILKMMRLCFEFTRSFDHFLLFNCNYVVGLFRTPRLNSSWGKLLVLAHSIMAL